MRQAQGKQRSNGIVGLLASRRVMEIPGRNTSSFLLIVKNILGIFLSRLMEVLECNKYLSYFIEASIGRQVV